MPGVDAAISWTISTTLANISFNRHRDEEIESVLAKIVTDHAIDVHQTSSVFVGRDTRPSSPFLAKAVVDGVRCMGGECTDYGVVSTPQLHFFVTCHNTGNAYGEPNEEGYFSKMASAFKALRSSPNNGSYRAVIALDGANGVGALKMKTLQQYLGDCLQVSLYNTGDGKLNHQCGADFVKVQQKCPENMPITAGLRAASIDGKSTFLGTEMRKSPSTYRCLCPEQATPTVWSISIWTIAESSSCWMATKSPPWLLVTCKSSSKPAVWSWNWD